MPKVTYFAVLPFSRDADGDFLPEAATDVRSAAEITTTAARTSQIGRSRFLQDRGPATRRMVP